MTMGDRIAVMKDGILQQVAKPRDIYENPANMYVAGFIGSPTMNFIPVTIQGKTANASGFKIELPRAPGVEQGVLGIRPEAVDEHPREGQADFELKVEVVEVLGADQYLYGHVGADAITARVDPNLSVAPGDRVKLGIDMRRLHVFDPPTGKALL
jgi:multiple sugar transport system ATP-binding protein